MRIAQADARPSLHLGATARCSRRLGREPGFAARVRPPGAAESDGCQPKSRDAGADAPADGASAGLPARGSDWTRGRAAAGCVSVCMFLSVRLRATLRHRMARRARAVLAAPSPPASPRNPRGRRDLPARARGDAALGAWSRRRKQPTNMDSESDGMAGGIGDGVMPRQISFRCPHARRRPARPRSTTLRACLAHSRHPSPGR